MADFVSDANVLWDQYGNRHVLKEELARGGQGVVYSTADEDLAIKQPFGTDGMIATSAKDADRFASVRCLPLPDGIPISLPLATLRDAPGYVMALLSGMTPLQDFELSTKRGDRAESVPTWLAGADERNARTLVHYAATGSTKRRLAVLAKVASILTRLHAAGLVYGDISPNNCFMGPGESPAVWLIDADNLRFELRAGGPSVYTPRFGAPEIVQGFDSSRPQTDCWAFSVMAFATLALVHPFIGARVLDFGDDAGGWDDDAEDAHEPADLDEQAYAGLLPFVDDIDDGSNPATAGLPRRLLLTSQLSRLFQETLGAGRTQPWRRPAMCFWALELYRAHDRSVACYGCGMSHFIDTHDACPYCDRPSPARVVAATPHWQIALPSKEDGVLELPHRLFHPFSPRLGDDAAYRVELDADAKKVRQERGSAALPSDVTFKFLGEGE